jgi:hypothetical protein
LRLMNPNLASYRFEESPRVEAHAVFENDLDVLDVANIS